MFTNKASATLFTALLTGGLLSCQTELLNPIPETLFSDQVVFDTPSRIQLQINNLYTSVKNGNFLGGRYQVYGDIRADDFLNRTNNGVTGVGVWNHTLTETSINDVTNLWGSAYSAINQINVFLDGLEVNKAKYVAPTFPTTFATTAVQYQAEGRLLRALSYYSLLQFYARPFTDGNGSKPGLPLRLKAEKSSENNDLARSTVAEVYTQILDDLNFAEQNLPLTYGDAPTRVSRAHRNTAIALKTRVYLSMARYADVVTEANKIVSATAPFVAATGVAHALASNVAAVFAPPQETTESILAFPFTAQNAPGTQNQLAFYFLPSTLGGNGEFNLNKTGIVGNTTAWTATDARRTNFVVTVGGDAFLKKYPTGTPFTDRAPVIRYAEVLLNLAEAKARTTNAVDPQALALLNAVRGRSDASAVYTAASFTTPAALIDAILLERRIEFLGEGLRNNDILRLNATIPAKGAVGAIAPSNINYVWPIPSTELST
ncbi:MAG: RagB/SusD family nutrient uptake outer membrane protein, partial [Sphingobacteriaceae bacterium]|nr:RagB/SusD family nutrient uptake outer membrane protein [Cytophagaceae bacterium]